MSTPNTKLERLITAYRIMLRNEGVLEQHIDKISDLARQLNTHPQTLYEQLWPIVLDIHVSLELKAENEKRVKKLIPKE